eukprot:jgi/Chrzof1/6250/Cz17g17130.t1
MSCENILKMGNNMCRSSSMRDGDYYDRQPGQPGYGTQQGYQTTTNTGVTDNTGLTGKQDYQKDNHHDVLHGAYGRTNPSQQQAGQTAGTGLMGTAQRGYDNQPYDRNDRAYANQNTTVYGQKPSMGEKIKQAIPGTEEHAITHPEQQQRRYDNDGYNNTRGYDNTTTGYGHKPTMGEKIKQAIPGTEEHAFAHPEQQQRRYDNDRYDNDGYNNTRAYDNTTTGYGHKPTMGEKIKQAIPGTEEHAIAHPEQQQRRYDNDRYDNDGVNNTRAYDNTTTGYGQKPSMGERIKQAIPGTEEHAITHPEQQQRRYDNDRYDNDGVNNTRGYDNTTTGYGQKPSMGERIKQAIPGTEEHAITHPEQQQRRYDNDRYDNDGVNNTRGYDNTTTGYGQKPSMGERIKQAIPGTEEHAITHPEQQQRRYDNDAYATAQQDRYNTHNTNTTAGYGAGATTVDKIKQKIPGTDEYKMTHPNQQGRYETSTDAYANQHNSLAAGHGMTGATAGGMGATAGPDPYVDRQHAVDPNVNHGAVQKTHDTAAGWTNTSHKLAYNLGTQAAGVVQTAKGMMNAAKQGVRDGHPATANRGVAAAPAGVDRVDATGRAY